MEKTTLESFAGDRRKRWQVDRGLEIVWEPSCPTEIYKSADPELRWQKVAGIGTRPP